MFVRKNYSRIFANVMSCNPCLHIEFAECGDIVVMRSLTFSDKQIEVRLQRSPGKTYVVTANADAQGTIAIRTGAFPAGFWVAGQPVALSFYHEGEQLIFRRVNHEEHECVTITLVEQEYIGEMPAPPHQFDIRLRSTGTPIKLGGVEFLTANAWAGIEYDLPDFASPVYTHEIVAPSQAGFTNTYIDPRMIGKPGRYRTQEGEWVDFTFNGVPAA